MIHITSIEPVEPDEDTAWNNLVDAAALWGNKYLDQWDEFSVNTDYGPIYIKIGRSVPDPENYPVINQS